MLSDKRAYLRRAVSAIRVARKCGVRYPACSRIGAALNPLTPSLGESELSFMRAHGEAKVFDPPWTLRGSDQETMARALQASLPTLKHVVIMVGGAAMSSTRC